MSRSTIIRSVAGSGALLVLGVSMVLAGTTAGHTVTLGADPVMSIAWNSGDGGAISSTALVRGSSDVAVGSQQQLDVVTDYDNTKVNVAAVITDGTGFTLTVTPGNATGLGSPTVGNAAAASAGGADMISNIDGAASQLVGSFTVDYAASVAADASLSTNASFVLTYTVSVAP